LGTSSGARTVQAANGRARIKVNLQGGESVIAVKSDGINTVFLHLK